MTYKICIVGGGTAGWMTASYLKSIYEDLVDISIVYDHSQPNIGVGESTTPIILEFLKQIGLSHTDLIAEIGSTVKLGIRFQNWTSEGEHYWHPFTLVKFNDSITDSNALSAYEIFTDTDKNAECYDPEYMLSGRVPIDETSAALSNFALHIDGDKFSKLLKERFKDKVEVLDDLIEDIVLDNQKISKLKLKSGKELSADLFVDCSGFSRLLISKITDSWASYNFPLMNRAIPIQIHEQPDLTQTYTLTEAHKNGWLWKIPLQTRYGIGYNYNSNYCSDDDAINNFKEILKSKNINYQGNFKILKFEPGYYKEQWKSNVLSVGLTTGFIEPLEATAIHMICNQLMHFIRHNTFFDDQYGQEVYNKKMSKMYEQTFEFIELHYHSERNDSEFWKNISKYRNKKLTNLTDKVKKSFLTASDILVDFDRIQGSTIFGLTGYTRVMSGLKMLNKMGSEHFLKISGLGPYGKETFDNMEHVRKEIYDASGEAISTYKRIKDGKCTIQWGGSGGVIS